MAHSLVFFRRDSLGNYACTPAATRYLFCTWACIPLKVLCSHGLLSIFLLSTQERPAEKCLRGSVSFPWVWALSYSKLSREPTLSLSQFVKILTDFLLPACMVAPLSPSPLPCRRWSSVLHFSLEGLAAVCSSDYLFALCPQLSEGLRKSYDFVDYLAFCYF